MAENSSKSEELTLQDVQAQVDGLQNDMKTMHERLDSTVTSSNERFDQLDLADTAARTTLVTIMTRLEAISTQLGTMTTQLTELQHAHCSPLTCRDTPQLPYRLKLQRAVLSCGSMMRVIVDNGLVRVALSTPRGQITAVSYGDEPNLLQYSAKKGSSGGYWDMVWNYPDSGHPQGLYDTLVMLRGSSGFYSYAIFEHAENYPALNITEARVVFKLNRSKFNYMAVTDDIQRHMPRAIDRLAPRGVELSYKEAVLLVDPNDPQFQGEVDDKYQYSLDNKDNFVHGWISSNDSNPVGFWVISTSNEFKSGGPIKRELTSHTGPTSLTMFLGTHYVGKYIVLNIEDSEHWKKVLGPVFIYINSIPKSDNLRALWEDAKAQAQAQGDFVRDNFMSNEDIPARMGYVGLASPGQPGSWATESKGFLGDYMSSSSLTIAPASSINVGDLVFKPPRKGSTMWEIGVPNRTAAEFHVPDPEPRYKSWLFTSKDRYRQYGLWERYAASYPKDDLVFIVGKSNSSKDWLYAQVTRMEGQNSMPTTWQIQLNLDRDVANGTYTLRIALASAEICRLQVQVNRDTTG
ncbi:hypothetical protein PR202_ga21937 [Eleusine coracana subsp. coracana]|uniref:Rhamnogalacturonan lyase domain-containing protein n=1 Tax=Eleusine coracana subsp. coracana TaxID=191504 RepID=A0AAV5D2Y8_ELECO|nr:hypothetical protein PR202_ga21937 [Eleusine coracana subsp. coracana]